MRKYTRRQADYRALSRWIQRIILDIAPPASVAKDLVYMGSSAAEIASHQVLQLEFSAPEPEEAKALRRLRTTLNDLNDATAREAPRARAAVVVSAAELAVQCADFASPPLNAIWAAAAPTRA